MTSPTTRSSSSSWHQFPTGSDAFPHRHLLGIAGLQPWEILFLLKEAEQWVDLNRKSSKRASRMNGLPRSEERSVGKECRS